MSTTVDQRVVEMRFDNKQFESNVSATMSTLDKLKEKLRLTDAAKGFDNISAAASRTDISPLGRAVEQVGLKFNAMYTIADQALRNIVNSAMSAGKRIVSSLTIDPIKTGFNEYELKMNATRTIMSSTGESLETVNKYLQELNEYSDQTIYSFSDMTSNIGKFTNAGVKLEDAVLAMRGIANEAALSGANANEASRAMYNFGQALSSGYVKLIDWKSIENANMATVEFKEELIKTGLEMGTIIKVGDKYRTTTTDLNGDVSELFDSTKMFNESLAHQWMTSEVLTATLGRYADETTEIGKKASKAATEVRTFTMLMDTLKEAAQSGWAQTWEILVGDMNEATKLWTSVSDVIGGFLGDSAKARNEMLQGWAEGGGRTALIDGLTYAFEGLMSVIKPIGEAFRKIFPRTTSEQLIKITEGFRNFTAKLVVSGETADKIKKTFEGIFSVFKVVVDVIKAVAKAAFSLIGNLGGIVDIALSVTSAIGGFVSGISTAASESNAFGKIMDTVTGALQRGIDKISEFAGKGIGGFGDFLVSVWNVIEKVASKIGEIISNITGGLASILKTTDVSSLMDIVNSGLMSGVILKLSKFLTSITKSFKSNSIFDSITDLFNSIADSFNMLGNALKTWQNEMKVSILLKIAGAIAILAVSIAVLASIEPDRLSSALGAVTMLIFELMGALKIAGKMGTDLTGAFKVATFMAGLSVAVLILASAMKKISDLDTDQIMRGLLGIAGMAAVLVASAKLMSKSTGKLISASVGLIAFATAMKILASVCIDLSSLKWEQLTKGLVGVGVLLGELAVFLNVAKFGKKVLTTSIGLIAIATAIKILETTFTRFGDMKWEEIGKGFVALIGVLGAFAAFSKNVGKTTKMLSTGVGFAIMASSLHLMADVLERFGDMTWESIAKGLIAVSGALTSLTLTSRLLPKTDFMLIATVLPVMTSTLQVIAIAFEKLGELSWEEIARGLAASGGAMMIFSMAMKSFAKTKGALKVAGSILVLSTALMAFAGVLSIISGMGVVGAIVALGTIAATFALLGGATKILKPLIPSMFKLSGAIATLSASFALLGLSLAAIGTGLGVFGGSLVAILFALQGVGFAEVASGLAVLAASFAVIGIAAKLLQPLTWSILTLSGSIALLGLSCMGVAMAISLTLSGLVALASVGKEGAETAVTALKVMITGALELVPTILETLLKSVKTVVIAIIDAVVDCVPAIVDGLLKTIVGVLQSLAQQAPQIVGFIMQFLVGIINAVADHMPELITAIVRVISSIFTGVVDALGKVDTDSLLKGLAGIGLLVGIMYALASVVSLTPMAMLGVLALGVVITELAVVLAAIGGLAQIPGLKWLVDEGADFMMSIGRAIGGLVGGIAGGIAEGFTNSMPAIATSLSEFMTNLNPFIVGAKSLDPSILDGVYSLIGVILALTGASIVEGLTSWITGGSPLRKFADEIVPFGKAIAKFSSTVSGNVDQAAVTAAANAGRIISEMAANLPNSGGVVGWFTGENDLGEFAKQIVPFGKAIAAFSSVVSGNVDEAAITSAANAGKVITEMANTIPNSGGLISMFAGDNSLMNFALQIIPFGKAMADFSDAVVGIDEGAVKAASVAGQTLTELAHTVPDTGGLVAFFAGDNRLDTFGMQLVPFGRAIKQFAAEVVGIDGGVVEAAATAGLALTEMANTVPNTGGLIAFFAGDNNLAYFGSQIVMFGRAMKMFSDELGTGINADSINAAAAAGSIMADMQSKLPATGGLISFFTGSNDMGAFGSQLCSFGKGLRGFADEIGTELNTDAITAAAEAGKILADMASVIPASGGLFSVFTGGVDMKSFAMNLVPFGKGIKGFADAVGEIETDSIIAAANAGKILAEMANLIPADHGLFQVFSGSHDMETFANQLTPFGEAIKGFATEVEGIKTDSVRAAANAGKTLAEMASLIPAEGGLFQVFTGSTDMEAFGANITAFGTALSGFSKAVQYVALERVSQAAKAGKTLAEMANTIPSSGGLFAIFCGSNDMEAFASNLGAFGEGIANFGSKIKGLKTALLKNALTQVEKLVDIAKGMEGMDFAELGKFGDNLKQMGLDGIDAFIDAFANSTEKLEEAGGKMIADLFKGVESAVTIGKLKLQSIATKLRTIIVDKIEEDKSKFATAGKYVVEGFASGITANTFKAEAAAVAMAEAALEAAKEALGIQSPSKEAYAAGDFTGQGFINALHDQVSSVYSAGYDMGDSAKRGLTSAIAKMSRLIDSEMDTQPTIRPILDLSDISNGVGAIDGMFGMTPSIAVMSNIGAISSMMGGRQNGGNSDVISAIKDLGNKLGNTSGDTYNINGVSANDDAEVTNAIKVLVRAAKVERRS